MFNNGITALSDETNLNKKIGKIGVGQLILKNPQIINGGQTAYTLSMLYQDVLDGKLDRDVFDKKEVLLKVITFSEESGDPNGTKLELIEAISKATNQQTTVTEADRRSNDRVQLELQELIFKELGLFYQRKAGEFGEGLRNQYIKRNQIIERELLLRLILASEGQPSQARSRGARTLFKKENFDTTLNDPSKAKEYVFAYEVYTKLSSIQGKFKKEINNRDGIVNYGHALRYGKFAVVSVIMKNYEKYKTESIEDIIESYMANWITFEEHIINLKSNNKYFREVTDPETQIKRQILNYDGYYKGTTINKQVIEFPFQ
ncbi:MAG: AIPR family protein [Bacteroidota bacterium]